VSPKGGSSLKITPREIEVTVGESKSFKGHGGTPPYAFAFAPSGNVSGGVVDRDTGAYTAGSTTGTDTVRVTDAAGDTDDARITVLPPLTIAPASVTLECGGTQSFRADGGIPPHTFDWAPGGDTTGGSIEAGASSGTGAYVAGQTPGTDRVRVSDARGNSADATIDVVAQLKIAVTDATVVAGTSTGLEATGGTPPYTFAFAPSGNVSGGTLDSENREYTAGPTPGTDTIEVTDDIGNTARTTVEVRPPLQIEVPVDEMHKVQLSARQDLEWWETYDSWGDTPARISSALEITVATGVEVALRVVGGVPDFSVAATAASDGTAGSPASGDSTFTYEAGLTVGGDRRATDTLTITDGQSTPNQATVTVTVTENFEDLAALASSGVFKAPFCTLRTWNPFAGFSLHDGVIFPPPPAAPKDKLPCIDFGILHTTGLQSLPSRGHAGERGPVKAPGGAYLLGRGTDAGFGIVHISIPINNVLLPLVIALGESKSLFGSSSVRLPCWSVLGGSDDCDTACAVPVPWVPLSLNLACSDEFPLPSDLVVAPSTIMLGLSIGDIIGGLIDVIMEYTVALVMWGFGKGAGQISEAAFKKGPGKIAKNAAKKAAKEVGEKVTKEVAEKAAKEATEKILKEGTEQVVQEAVEKAAKEAAEKAAKEAAEKTAKEAAERAARKAAEEASEKAAREAAEGASKKAVKEASDKAAKEAAEKAAKQATEEAVEKAAKEAAEKAAKEAAGEAAKEGVGEAAEEAAAGGAKKGFWQRLQADKIKQLRKDVAFTGLSDDEILDRLFARSGWEKTWDILKGPTEAIVFEQPLGWIGGRLGKIDDTVRGLEEFDRDWWEFGEIIPWVESPIVQRIWPQPPAGGGWWGD
jgi:hypothetical protein